VTATKYVCIYRDLPFILRRGSIPQSSLRKLCAHMCPYSSPQGGFSCPSPSSVRCCTGCGCMGAGGVGLPFCQEQLGLPC